MIAARAAAAYMSCMAMLLKDCFLVVFRRLWAKECNVFMHAG